MAREMKDSGIEWIGNLPSHWSRNKVIRLFSVIGSGTTPKTTDETAYIGDVNWLQSGDINGTFIYTSKNTISQTTKEYYSVLKTYSAPFIIVAMYGASIGNASISLIDACVNQACCVLAKPKINLHYAFYTLKAAQSYLTKQAVGGGQPNISQDKIKTLWLPVPSNIEQQKIVDYLDRKCAEIDRVLEKTRASIEEYKKLKQSVITQAVTKGVRGEREMKDSGIEWIGEIPAEWKISRIKYVSSFEPPCDTSRLSPDSVITYTPMEYIKNGYYVPNTATLSSLSTSLTSYQSGDIVMAKVTPCFENGNISIMNNLSSAFGLGSSELFVFRAKSIHTQFLFYWLRNNRFVQTACSTMTGTGGLKRVSSLFVKDSSLAVPPESEQIEIANYLDKKCSEIDTLISKKEQFITELESYKKSLIYEYVTGKKEAMNDL